MTQCADEAYLIGVNEKCEVIRYETGLGSIRAMTSADVFGTNPFFCHDPPGIYPTFTAEGTGLIWVVVNQFLLCFERGITVSVCYRKDSISA